MLCGRRNRSICRQAECTFNCPGATSPHQLGDDSTRLRRTFLQRLLSAISYATNQDEYESIVTMITIDVHESLTEAQIAFHAMRYPNAPRIEPATMASSMVPK